MDRPIVPSVNAELMQTTDVPSIMEKIRPVWRVKSLVERTRRLMRVDPSSACQRIFNAAIHDLREKVVIAGLDIAKQAAAQNKLPQVERPDDVERYSTAKLIDLAYYMGLLSRPEYRKMTRVYDIRKDLEHEDDEYEAGLEDCVYVFKTCIEVVLARDPVTLIRVQDIKDIVEQPGPAALSHEIVEDYAHAPQPRQQEITLFLVSTALNDKQPDIVRRNAVTSIQTLESHTQNSVKLEIAKHLQDRLARKPMDHVFAKLAQACGVLAYLKTAQRTQFFEHVLEEMAKASPGWTAYEKHGIILRDLREVGGLAHIPPAVRKKIVEWMVLTYIGEPGGYGTWGRSRKVFYSDTAAPLIRELVKNSASVVKSDIEESAKSSKVKAALRDEHVSRRHEQLLDIVEMASLDLEA
ncbi:MAG: hypothetical protein ACOX3G_00090 [Armatimonadota bacterium]